MSLQLFDGSDSENDNISKIRIHEEYARRFEHNKRREDLQRFEELKKSGVIDSPSPSEDDESESESSDDEYEINFNSKSEKEFFDALIKVKKKDPVLKQKDVKLFESDDSSEEESDDEKSKSKDKDTKAMYLKDVTAKHLIEEGPDFGDNEEETNENEDGISKVSKGKRVISLNQEEAHFENKDGKKTYGDEQEELKRAFLEAEKQGLGDEEGDFLTFKEKADEDKVDSDDKELEEKQNDYFSGDYESNESYGFLRNYFMDKMWMDKNAEKLNVVEEDLQEISEDDMEIERQEEYEYQFQENPEDSVLGHARKVEGSVRKRTNTRKAQRKSKEERMAITQKERDEEVKHLKNVKKQEIQETVKNIMKIAGIDDVDNEKEKSSKKGSRKRKHKTSIWEIAKEAMDEKMDEYYGIEYEDIIGGDLKTRFKYAKTKPNKFSISTPEILLVDDKELNQHIPLKKLAPYQEKEWKLSKQKRNMLKMRAKEHAACLDKKKIKKSKVDSSKLTSLNNAVEVEKANTTSLDKKEKKKSKVDSRKLTSSNSVVEDEKAKTEESKSRKAKRRENMAKLKLSKLRLKAYGKTT